MLVARFSLNLQRKTDLTNAFKSFFCDDSLSYAAKSLHSLFLFGGGRAHACARAHASEKLRTTRFATCRVLRTTRLGTCHVLRTTRFGTCCFLRTTRFGTCHVPYHETLVRARGKDLARGQVALIDPT